MTASTFMPALFRPTFSDASSGDVVATVVAFSTTTLVAVVQCAATGLADVQSVAAR